MYRIPEFVELGNLPVEGAKDGVCFLQRCGVRPSVIIHRVVFCSSLASSAIIYNHLVKVKVTRRPV